MKNKKTKNTKSSISQFSCLYTFMEKKTPQIFWDITMAFRKKILGKKKMNRVWDRFTLGAIRDEVDYQTKTQIWKERRSKISKKNQIFLHNSIEQNPKI